MLARVLATSICLSVTSRASSETDERIELVFATTHTHTHTRLTAFFRDYPGELVPERQKPIWILLKQETVSGSGISWAICKSAPQSRQITTPAPHHSVFYRPDALLVTQPTLSKHWRPVQPIDHKKQNMLIVAQNTKNILILPYTGHMAFKTLCYTEFLTGHFLLQQSYQQLSAIQLQSVLPTVSKSDLWPMYNQLTVQQFTHSAH